MTIHHNNYLILKKHLTMPECDKFASITSNQIHRWHRLKFTPETSSAYGMIALKDTFSGGGGASIEEFTIDGSQYIFKVNAIDADHVGIRDLKVVEIDSDITIYFISLLAKHNESNNFNCISLLVYPDSGYASIDGLTKKYPCVGVKHRDRIEIYPGPKKGEILIKALLQFCHKYASTLKIKNLELGDEAAFPCGKPEDKISINLSLSNQLTGRQLYYIQFGFRPTKAADMILKKNEMIMQKYNTTIDFMTYLEKYLDSDIPEHISIIINNNLGKPLTQTLRLIFERDCRFYSEIYQHLFERFNLKRLSANDNIFHMKLE